MSKNTDNVYGVELKFRGQASLKSALSRLAKAERVKPSEFMRNALWKIVDQKNAELRQRILDKAAR